MLREWQVAKRMASCYIGIFMVFKIFWRQVNLLRNLSNFYRNCTVLYDLTLGKQDLGYLRLPPVGDTANSS
jgi:hypothetical protein